MHTPCKPATGENITSFCSHNIRVSVALGVRSPSHPVSVVVQQGAGLPLSGGQSLWLPSSQRLELLVFCNLKQLRYFRSNPKHRPILEIARPSLYFHNPCALYPFTTTASTMAGAPAIKTRRTQNHARTALKIPELGVVELACCPIFEDVG